MFSNHAQPFLVEDHRRSMFNVANLSPAALVDRSLELLRSAAFANHDSSGASIFSKEPFGSMFGSLRSLWAALPLDLFPVSSPWPCCFVCFVLLLVKVYSLFAGFDHSSPGHSTLSTRALGRVRLPGFRPALQSYLKRGLTSSLIGLATTTTGASSCTAF
jgi:hypothetical protein